MECVYQLENKTKLIWDDRPEPDVNHNLTCLIFGTCEFWDCDHAYNKSSCGNHIVR